MMIQTATQDGDISIYDLRNGQTGFGLLATDEDLGTRTRLHLTADQAADLLESLVSLGVRVNDLAQAALDRSA